MSKECKYSDKQVIALAKDIIWYELTFKEAAERHGMPVSTVSWIMLWRIRNISVNLWRQARRVAGKHTNKRRSMGCQQTKPTV